MDGERRAVVTRRAPRRRPESAVRARRGPRCGGRLRGLLAAALAALTASCVTVPPEQLAFAVSRDEATGAPLPCVVRVPAPREATSDGALPGDALRVVSWNIHKNGDRGWEADLSRLVAGSDLLLLQEASLTAQLRTVLTSAGFDGLLASSFALNGRQTGVLSAARVRPTRGCVQRRFEPLIQLPKSALITRYRLDGTAEELAVANVHSINFAVTLDDYRAQLDAVANELADHVGPLILAGDFNTWNPVRLWALDEVVRRLGLVPVAPAADLRSRFLGHQVDHVYVRSLEVVDAHAPEVRSSDHNPVVATLRYVQVR